MALPSYIVSETEENHFMFEPGITRNSSTRVHAHESTISRVTVFLLSANSATKDMTVGALSALSAVFRLTVL